MMDVEQEVEECLAEGDFAGARIAARAGSQFMDPEDSDELFRRIRMAEILASPAPKEFVLELFGKTFPDGVFTGTHAELRDALGLGTFKTQQVRYAMWRGSAWEQADCCADVPVVRGRPDGSEPGSGVYSYRLVA